MPVHPSFKLVDWEEGLKSCRAPIFSRHSDPTFGLRDLSIGIKPKERISKVDTKEERVDLRGGALWEHIAVEYEEH